TDAHGCSALFATNLVNVINDPLPEPIINSSGPACEGETIILTTGQYAGSNVDYAWLKGNQILPATSNQLIISPVSAADAGTYKVLVQVDDCVLESGGFTVTVHEQPAVAPDYDLSNTCEGGTLQLFANATQVTGNATYHWTGPNGFESFAPNPFIPNTNSEDNGAYTVEVTSPAGCSASASIVVTEIHEKPEMPVILGEELVCAGEIIHLSIQQAYAGNSVSIVWRNANGQIIGMGDAINISASNPNAIPPFTAQVSVDGCLSDFSAPKDVQIIASPLASASNNGPICVGETVQLFAGTIPDATYSWRIAGQTDVISVEQNPTLFNVDTTTTFELVVYIDACASELIATTTVVVEPMPVVGQMIGGGVYCENDTLFLTAQNLTPISADLHYTWSGPNNLNFSGIAPADESFDFEIPGVTTANSGTYTLTLETPGGCTSLPVSAVVTVQPAPPAPVLSANETVLCQGQSLILTATPMSGSGLVYEWYFDDGTNNFLLGATAQPSYVIPSAMPSNAGYYSVKVNINGCESGLSNSLKVDVFGAAIQIFANNSTDPDHPVCEGGDVILDVPFIPGATYQWFGPNNFTSNLYSPVVEQIPADGAGEYFVVITLNGCSSVVSEPTTVYVTHAPTAPTIASNGPICEGETARFEITSNLNLSPTDTVFFEWYYAQTNALLGITDTTVFEIPNAPAGATGDYYVIMHLNGCAASPSLLAHLEVSEIPGGLTANAGADQNLCAAQSAELQASAPLAGTGIWTTTGTATIADPFSPNTTVSSLSEGANEFIWTVTVEGCGTFAADTVIVFVDIVPVDEAYAGEDQTLCGVHSIQLNALAPQLATGTWTQPPAQTAQGVSILEPNNPNSEVTGLEEGETYTFTWTLSQGACGDFASDEVTYTINTAPLNVAYVPEEIIYACGMEEFLIQAEMPTEGTGIWTTNTNALIVNPTLSATIVADLDLGVNTFYWTLSADGCPNFSQDSVQIIVEEAVLAANDTFHLMFNESMPDSSLIDNDFLGNTDSWTFTILDRPNHGTAIPNFDAGSVAYDPVENFFGVDTLIYEICNANCGKMQCDTATVLFVVYGMNGSGDCFAPNMITPNDDGMNDALIFPCLESMYPENAIMVFNRWGDKVYEKHGYQNDWHGTFNGRPLPAGAYYYILQLEPGAEPMKGFFTIIR
ncbi:MAG: PKD domain-containing protein, partial [Bacteroidetes bacterium]